MNFIRKLFLGKGDDHVHSQFVRYSLGEYSPKAVVTIKNGTSAKIVTSFEYVNDFLAMIGECAKGEVEVHGKIFLKRQMDTPFSLSKKKGYLCADIDQTMTPKTLAQWVTSYGTEGYLLLNVTGNGIIFKTKTAPHNPKGKYDMKYCTLTVSSPLKDVFLQDVAFDAKGAFKQATITHTFHIADVIIPKEYEHDMALARIHAKRKGKVVRSAVIDGKEIKTEKEFVA
ncbi:hypothetical protein HY639_01795 [Candidatus Woesearchaeota archaeon]|nr:hypothetical protein [Candidatus Woesearchaeota archaeon]